MSCLTVWVSEWVCCGRPRESQGTEWPRLHSIRTCIVRIPQVQLLPTLRISSGLAFGNRRNIWRKKNRTPSYPNIISPSNQKHGVAKTESKQVGYTTIIINNQKMGGSGSGYRLQQQTSDSAKRPRNFGSQSQSSFTGDVNWPSGSKFWWISHSPQHKVPRRDKLLLHLSEWNTKEHSITLYQTQNYPPRATAAAVLTILQEGSTSPN